MEEMDKILASSLLLTIAAICFGIFLAPAIFYILTLRKALLRCDISSRTISPAMLWLFLIPFVNLVWNFFMVLGMAKSLGNEFRRRGITVPDPNPGQAIGLAMCICAACIFIPLLGFLLGLAYLALWIVYWVKIAEYSRMLSELPQAIATYPS